MILTAVIFATLISAGRSPAAGPERVAVFRFSPVSEADPPELGETIAGQLRFSLGDGQNFTAVPQIETERALREVLLLEPGTPLTNAQAVEMAKALRAPYVVYGSYQQADGRIRAYGVVVAASLGKFYKVQVTSQDVFGVQDALAAQVRKAIAQGKPEAAKPATVAAGPGAAAPAEPDPLALKIRGMSAEDRHLAAVQEFNQGVKAEDGGDVAQARTRYETALRYQEDHAPALYNLGRLAYDQKDWAAVVESFRKYVQIKPDDPDVPVIKQYIDDAERRLAKEALQEVEVQFVPTAEQKRWSAIEWFNNALGLHKQPTLAIEYYKQAVERDPTLAQAHYNMGKLYYDLDRYGEAVAAFEKYLQHASADDPDRPVIENLVQKLRAAGN